MFRVLLQHNSWSYGRIDRTTYWFFIEFKIGRDACPERVRDVMISVSCCAHKHSTPPFAKLGSALLLNRGMQIASSAYGLTAALWWLALRGRPHASSAPLEIRRIRIR